MSETCLSDYFQSAYVINLPDRKDRRRTATRELEKMGMPLRPGRAEIFPAVKVKEKGGFSSVGDRGCFLSHLAVLNLAVKRKLRNVVIIEDDLKISDRLIPNVSGILRQLEDTPWGMFYFGYYFQTPPDIRPAPPADPVRLIPCVEAVRGTHFYAVNGPAIPRMAAYLAQILLRDPGDPLGGPMYIDGAHAMFRGANPDIVTLLAHPSLAIQRPSRSDIMPHWYERFGAGKHAADLARVIRDRFRAEKSF